HDLMTNALKAIAFCLIAQGLFVVRTRLGALFFGDTGALALTALCALAGGGVLAAIWRKEMRAQLGLKSAVLACAAAGLGVALHTSLDLAAREVAGSGAAALMTYVAPVVLLLVAVAMKWEPMDRLRLGALVAGAAAVGWLIAGPATLKELVA